MKTRHQFIEDPCSPDRSGQIGTGNPLAFAVHRLKDQRGVAAIIVAIVLVVLIGFAALAIDIGYLYATRNELQNAADAAALIGAGQLGYVYTQMDIGDHDTYEYDPEGDEAEQDIVDLALEVALKNEAARKNVIILENEVQVGRWKDPDLNPNGFYLTNQQPDAVKVKARRDETVPTERVTTFFAKILGIPDVAVTAKATASLTPPTGVAPGILKLPVALSINEFEPEPNCDDEISLSPTSYSCAGWHNFFDAINANAMKWKLIGFIKGDPLEGEDCLEEPCGGQWLIDKFGWSQDQVDDLDSEVTPETDDDDSFDFQGGDIAALFTGAVLLWEEDRVTPVMDTETDKQMVDGNPTHPPASMPALFDYFRFRDGDDDDSSWTTTIPIYEDDPDCTNPNQSLEIVGFSEIKVTEVKPPPDKSFIVEMDCKMKVIEARSGSGPGIVKGSIPNLVE